MNRERWHWDLLNIVAETVLLLLAAGVVVFFLVAAFGGCDVARDERRAVEYYTRALEQKDSAYVAEIRRMRGQYEYWIRQADSTAQYWYLRWNACSMDSIRRRVLPPRTVDAETTMYPDGSMLIRTGPVGGVIVDVHGDTIALVK